MKILVKYEFERYVWVDTVAIPCKHKIGKHIIFAILVGKGGIVHEAPIDNIKVLSLFESNFNNAFRSFENHGKNRREK